ncbi:MAG: Gfo/Idh/MocA family oxidoreductase [Planctomycetota bacterium]
MSQSSQPVRVAVIGAGHLGKFHARLAAANDAYQLVAVVDPCQAARDALAAETGCRPVEDYKSLLGLIDAAVVATPTVTHHAIGLELLAAGVHCLIEKPLAPGAREADDLVRLAAARNAVLQVGHVERFNPAFCAAKPRLANPKFITATRTSGYTFRSTDIGAVLDIMIHDIDLVLGIAGCEVVDVSAVGASVLGGHEDLANAQLTFESGCIAQLTASRVSYEMRREMKVFTPSGFVAMDFATGQTTTVTPSPAVLRGGLQEAAPTAEDRQRLRTTLFEELLVKSSSEAAPVNAIELEQHEFAVAIRTGAQPTVPGGVGRDAVAVAERVIEAIEQHAWDGNTTQNSDATQNQWRAAA